MAILDPRLVPFIGMLSEVGLDWLAFELVDGVRRGREPEENVEALKRAREHVRAGERKIAALELGGSVEAEPLVGDDQVEWAARYVEERLGATLDEMAASFNNIDCIVGSIRDEETLDVVHAGDRPSPSLLLIDGKERRKVDRGQLEAAQGHLPELRRVLAIWLANALTGLAQ
jgi:predicted NBD/HSP70 family sugar kinase